MEIDELHFSSLSDLKICFLRLIRLHVFKYNKQSSRKSQQGDPFWWSIWPDQLVDPQTIPLCYEEIFNLQGTRKKRRRWQRNKWQQSFWVKIKRKLQAISSSTPSDKNNPHIVCHCSSSPSFIFVCRPSHNIRVEIKFTFIASWLVVFFTQILASSWTSTALNTRQIPRFSLICFSILCSFSLYPEWIPQCQLLVSHCNNPIKTYLDSHWKLIWIL